MNHACVRAVAQSPRRGESDEAGVKNRAQRCIKKIEQVKRFLVLRLYAAAIRAPKQPYGGEYVGLGSSQNLDCLGLQTCQLQQAAAEMVGLSGSS